MPGDAAPFVGVAIYGRRAVLQDAFVTLF